MQNLILHPAKQTRTTAQGVRRIGKRNIVITPFFYQYKGTIWVLLFTYGCETGTIRCRIRFCIQHNQLERQHKSSDESGKELSNRVPTSSTSIGIDFTLAWYRYLSNNGFFLLKSRNQFIFFVIEYDKGLSWNIFPNMLIGMSLLFFNSVYRS
jgi:hypothetical protein